MNKQTPYPELLVEILPSRMMAGEIGLFAVRRLEKGALPAPANRYDEGRFIPWSEYARLDEATRRGLRKFCASSSTGCHAPEDLNFIHPLWYCNHSCDPNVAYDTGGNLHALREIEPGEELCFDYATVERLQPPASSLQPPASSLQPPASSLQPPASSLQPPASSLQPMQCRCGSTKCKGLVDFL